MVNGNGVPLFHWGFILQSYDFGFHATSYWQLCIDNKLSILPNDKSPLLLNWYNLVHRCVLLKKYRSLHKIYPFNTQKPTQKLTCFWLIDLSFALPPFPKKASIETLQSQVRPAESLQSPKNAITPSLKLTARPWKMVVGKTSFLSGFSLFSGTNCWF